MTEWDPHGVVPPLTAAEWDTAFEKYKRTPEYLKLNQDMTMDGFKFIYFFEWSHRMLGRAVGVAFGLPLVYFALRKRIPPGLGSRLALLFAMGGTQGMIGWWMVKSGLDEKLLVHKEKPRVSPYRLTVHLTSAFIIYSLLLSTGFQLMAGPNRSPVAALANVPWLRPLALAVTGLVFVTVVSGAFVAGNEAGVIYNEFPKMGGRWIPSDLINPYLEPAWRNMFENHTMVQFNHRILGVSTATAVTILWFLTRRAALPRQITRAATMMFHMAALQVTLGITTLLHGVPVPLAATHQAGSMALLSFALYFLHTLGPRASSSTAKTVTHAAAAAANAQVRAFSTWNRFVASSASAARIRNSTLVGQTPSSASAAGVVGSKRVIVRPF